LLVHKHIFHRKIQKYRLKSVQNLTVIYYACIINFLYLHTFITLMKERTIDYTLRNTWQGIVKMYNEEAKKMDSTMATGFTLLSIDPKTGTPSTSLGPKMGLESTSISRILNNLEKKALIERKAHPLDGRSVLIHLTPEGIKMRDLSKSFVLDFHDKVMEKTSKIQLKHFFEVVDIINQITSERS
jgi:DNA-binding MarR family transcriptional regulator